jgi:hypothetical protein
MGHCCRICGRVLRGHARAEIADLAGLLLEIGRVLPGKHNRWLKLARRHPQLFDRTITLLGIEYFEYLLAAYGKFESPLWDVIEETRIAPPWIARPCDCGSGRSFRDCCLERENEQIDAEVRDLGSRPDQHFEDGPPE